MRFHSAACPFSLFMLRFSGARALRFAQAEVTSLLVKRHDDFVAAIVGRHHFGNLLPIRRVQIHCIFENKIVVGERPEKAKICVAVCNTEVNASRVARVQQHGNAATVSDRQVESAVEVEIADHH